MLGSFRSSLFCLRSGILILFIQLFYSAHSFSQITSYNFRHLTNNEGLSDGMIQSFVQDKFGFIWIGTRYGLNRFDGINIKSWFYDPHDDHSLMNSYVYSLYRDSKGNLWVGTKSGLCRYDYSNNQFIRYTSSPVTITDILEDKKGRIWLGSQNGLWLVNESKQTIEKFILKNDTVFQKKFQCVIHQMISSPGGEWYFASDKGVKIFNPLTYAYDEIRYNPNDRFSLSHDIVYSVAFDVHGNLWAGCSYLTSILNKIDLKNHVVKYYEHFTKSGTKNFTNTINRIFIDKKGRVWVTSSASGLSLYNEGKDDFTDYTSNALVSNSLLSNQNGIMYQDSQGIIWIGTTGYGACFFNPDRSFFSVLFPTHDQTNALPDNWCRSVCEDKQNNLWLGTGRGLIKYDRQTQKFAIIKNDNEENKVIHYNSIRSLLQDDYGDIWIGTARGLNRYRSSTKQIDFFDNKQGIPLAFFWMMTQDKNGAVWFGSASGLYRYQRKENRFDDLLQDSMLSKHAHQNVQALFLDSQNCLWIGILNKGLVIYDINNKTEKLLTIKDSLISDTRFSSFAEDKNGIIWIGSEYGLAAYDRKKNCSMIFTHEDGLPSDRTNSLMVDSFNRLWIGTSNGLCMLSADRKRIKRFDIYDGLLTTQFNEQAAYKTHDGLFVYPAYKGFLVFRPEEYRENVSKVPVYITSFNVPGKKTINNTENLEQISLRYNQNFFSIELAGLNYINPYQCVYAYKLEPFEKDWKLTNKREISYTNVPAGKYSFRYKVITDDPNWAVPEKTLAVSIGQVFYKTWWFRTFLLLIFAGIVISFYRYRLSQREKILVLQNKAQLLEKEKTMVQYESLKQQLNPHFLFNSLTSLRSLIKTDTKTAAGFLDGLSKVYRYVLKSGDNDMVPLKDELDFVRTFVELQKTRFKEGLQVKICVAEDKYNKYVAPVTLQGLIENAIKHNTADTESPLLIEIFTEDNRVVVRNNLQRYRIVETSNKKGLAGLQSLYHYYSDTPVEITDDANYFTVKIPLL